MGENGFEELLSSVLNNKELMTKISSITDESEGLESTLPKIIATLSPVLDNLKSAGTLEGDVKTTPTDSVIDKDDKISESIDGVVLNTDVEINESGDDKVVKSTSSDIKTDTSSTNQSGGLGILSFLEKGKFLSLLSESISKNSKLLTALKPYLRKERTDVIDSILKMAQVANLLKLVK